MPLETRLFSYSIVSLQLIFTKVMKVSDAYTKEIFVLA